MENFWELTNKLPPLQINNSNLGLKKPDVIEITKSKLRDLKVIKDQEKMELQ